MEERDGYYKVTGRTSEVINVGGLKFMAQTLNELLSNIRMSNLLKQGKWNPITGQHVELTVQPSLNAEVDESGLKAFLAEQLSNHMMPKRIRVASVSVGHRFKGSRKRAGQKRVLFSRSISDVCYNSASKMLAKSREDGIKDAKFYAEYSYIAR